MGSFTGQDNLILCSGGGNTAKETEKATEKAATETTQAAGGEKTDAPAETEAAAEATT